LYAFITGCKEVQKSYAHITFVHLSLFSVPVPFVELSEAATERLLTKIHIPNVNVGVAGS